MNRPPVSSRRADNKKKSQRTNNFKVQALSNNFMLQGLEEDIIEMDEDEPVRSNENINSSERRGSDSSTRDLGGNNLLKSIPTDKFYLELEKKFAIQNKELYEKKEQERLR